jgi:hypothetical protein
VNLLLLASGFHAQYRVLRCAAALGGRVVVLGSRDAAALSMSRYCHRFEPFTPTEGQDPGDIAAEIDALARRHGAARILPSDLPTTRLLAQLGSRLQTPAFPVPDSASLDRLATKDRFLELCRDFGVPHPDATVYASFGEVVDALDQGRIRFPAMLKPVDQSGGLGVVRVDAANARASVSRLRYAPIVVEDYVEGVDRSITVLCRDGEVLREVTYSHPGGVFRFEGVQRLSRIVASLVAGLSLTGVVNFDARLDAHGNVWIVECNPRFWFNMDVAMIAGLNFADLTAVAASPALASVPDCEVCLPSAVPTALLRGRLPRTRDGRLLAHWLADPLVFALVMSRYGYRWTFPRLERWFARGKREAA